MPSKQPIPPTTSQEVLDWDHVDPQGSDVGKDVLGLSPSDRQALGLSLPKHADLEAPTLGGSELALAELLARGGAVRKTDFRRKR